MPFTPKPYVPPPLSNLRERLLSQQARRLSEHFETSVRSLQASLKSDLSPLEVRLNEQYLDNLKSAQERIANQLVMIRWQNVAETEAEQGLARSSPLERERNREGFYRSGATRTAAILGILERERRRSAPLTREAYARAEAIAASRRLYDPVTSQLRGQRGYGYDPSVSDILRSASYDPCVEYYAAVAARRQVMFAKGFGGKGYRSPHHIRKPEGC